MKQFKSFFSLSLVLVMGCAAVVVAPPSGATGAVSEQQVNADVAPRLLALLDRLKNNRTDRTELTQEERDLLSLTTPAGYRLRYRYSRLTSGGGSRGPWVAAVQAMVASQDKQLKDRLMETARWGGDVRARAEGLIALAAFRDPEHLKFLREALLDKNVSIQFASIEAMQIYGLPQVIPILLDAADNNWSPFIKVYAAQAALRMGDPRGRDKLLTMLGDSYWLTRAMAARYLGELGKPEDLDRLMARLDMERNTPFVLAEICIAALRLSPKKLSATALSEPAKPRKKSNTLVERVTDALELEPLIVTAPRSKMGPQPMDVRIDNSIDQLISLIPETMDIDSIVTEDAIKDLVTPDGFAIKLRYTDLSVLVAEGLAGSRDFSLIQRVERIAREAQLSRVRQLALVSLAYNPDRRDLGIFIDALRDQRLSIRFAGVESLNVLRSPNARGYLTTPANTDSSKIVRALAARGMAQSGDTQGREILLRMINDDSWLVRALAIASLGEIGMADDYNRILNRLNIEDNDYVIADACLALQRIASK